MQEKQENRGALDALAVRVIHFVAKETAIPAHKMLSNIDYRLNGPIGGLDGFELVHAFAKEFDVDISGVDFSKYFGAEGSGGPIEMILTLIESIRGRSRLPALTIGDFIDAARASRWPEEREVTRSGDTIHN
jgi:hypothetical protein